MTYCKFRDGAQPAVQRVTSAAVNTRRQQVWEACVVVRTAWVSSKQPCERTASGLPVAAATALLRSATI